MINVSLFAIGIIYFFLIDNLVISVYSMFSSIVLYVQTPAGSRPTIIPIGMHHDKSPTLFVTAQKYAADNGWIVNDTDSSGIHKLVVDDPNIVKHIEVKENIVKSWTGSYVTKIYEEVGYFTLLHCNMASSFDNIPDSHEEVKKIKEENNFYNRMIEECILTILDHEETITRLSPRKSTTYVKPTQSPGDFRACVAELINFDRSKLRAVEFHK